MPEEKLLQFSYGTQAEYDALTTYDEGTLYWTTDTLALYKGDKLYNGGVKLVSTLPISPALGVMYILTTNWSGNVWTGSAWKVITKPAINAITSSSTNEELPTAKAVYDFVTNFTHNGIVTNVGYNVSNNAITVEKDEETTEISITGMVHNATYDAATKKVTMPVVGSTAIEFTIPDDKSTVVTAGKYNSATNEIWFTLADDKTYTDETKLIKIPAADIFQEINVSNTSTLKMNYDVTNNTISGDVIISNINNNALKNSNGLYVDISNKIDKINATINAGKIIISKGEGDIEASTYAIGEKDEISGSNNKIAIESAVNAYVVSKINEIYTNAGSTNLATKEMVNTINSSLINYVNNSISNVKISWKTFNDLT